MLTRLGDVLYWIATVLAVLIVGIVVLALVLGDADERLATVVAFFSFIVAAAIYGIGRALRYILSGD